MFPRGLLLLASVLVRIQRGATQDSFVEVTSPESGDVYSAGDDVRVEWEAPLDSSFFNISLLNNGIEVVDYFCIGGCLAPNGFYIASLPVGLEAGSEYYFLIGDRLDEISNVSESGRFEIMATASSIETASGEEGDGDTLGWGIIIAAVAAGLGAIAVCILAVVCCRKRRKRERKHQEPTKSENGGSSIGGSDSNGNGKGGTAGVAKEAGATRELFVSTGGASDLSGFADMVALSPVHEENAEVVTKNPMISAMAKGAQFHSSGGGSNRFNSNGGSSKFPSLGEASSNGGGSWMRGQQGDDEEEGGGMFADADVVAALAAAAAQGVGKKDRTPLKTAGSGTPKWDGNWAKSPAWNRQKSQGGQLSPTSLAASKAEEKNAEDKAEDEAESPHPPEACSSNASTTDWMVFTRDSFNSRKSLDAAALLDTVRAEAAGLAAREEEKTESAGGEAVDPVEAPSMEEKKVEELEDVSTPTAVAAVAAAGEGPRTPAGGTYACSPLSVDGISAKAFEQAEVVTSALPVVKREGLVVSEPECEVPKPALSAGRRGPAKRQSDYSWLLSAPGTVEKPRPDEVRKSTDSPMRTSLGKSAVIDKRAPVDKTAPADPPMNATAGDVRLASPPSVGAASDTASRSPSRLPTEPAGDKAPPQTTPGQIKPAPVPGGGTTQQASRPDDGSTTAKPAQQGDSPMLLHLPPKAHGAAPRRAHLTPVAGGGGRGFNLASPLAAGAKSPRGNMSPRGNKSPRGPRVSQFVEVFEGLTPKSKGGQTSTAGPSTSSTACLPPVPGTSKNGPPKAKAMSWKPEVPKPAPAGAAKKSASTPGVLSPGLATGWSTPVATPDRGPRGAEPTMRKVRQGLDGSKDPAEHVAEDAAKTDAARNGSKGVVSVARDVPSGVGETPTRGAGSGWSTPVASPDRTPRAAGGRTKGPVEDLAKDARTVVADSSAPEELSVGSDAPCGGAGRGWSTPVATPDRTPRVGAPDSGPGGGTPECTSGAFASRTGKTGESPMDERHFAWQLESPAGVDGMPSPTGSSDPRRLAIGRKGGRIIPAILGVADTPVVGRAPLLTPSTANNKQTPHSLASSEGSSIGAGSNWDMERSFEASQVAAFVAHAQAEAAAEAEAAVVEARAEAEEEEAAERKSRGGDLPAVRVESKDAPTQSSPKKSDRQDGAAGAASREAPAEGAAADPVAAKQAPGDAGAAGAVAGLSLATSAPALATIAARLSPISAFPPGSPPAIVATPSPIIAAAPIVVAAAEELEDGEGVVGQAEAEPRESASEVKAQPPTSEAAQAEAQASQAVKAALAAATAAAEANAAAAAAAAEAAKASEKAEQAAKDAATARAAKQKLADEDSKKRDAEDVAAKEVEVAKKAAAKEVEAEPTVTTGAVVSKTGEVGVVNVSIYSAEAAANIPDVYNDGQDSDTETGDSDNQVDGSEEELEIDVGDERDWSTAAIPVATVEESGCDDQAVQKGGTVDDEGGSGVAGEAAAQEDVDSLSDEASQARGVATRATLLDDGAEVEGMGSHPVPTDDARIDTMEHNDGVDGAAHDNGTGAGGHYAGSPRGSVRDLVASSMLGSSSSALGWSEDGREQEGDAEREAEEVQALVAEALALVKEANEEV